MSTERPTPRVSPAVYRRRRLVVLLGILAVLVAIVLVIVRPGASAGDEADPSPAPTPTVATETAPPTSIPTEPTRADGEACEADQVLVEAVTDKVEYAPGEPVQLSLSVTNTGKNVCVLNAGTSAQVFTITSGEEVYWLSTDCQADPVDAQVSLAPAQPISSSVPISWDRTRSSPETCDQPREAVPGGGASFHLSVAVDGIESASTKQFLLY